MKLILNAVFKKPSIGVTFLMICRLALTILFSLIFSWQTPAQTVAYQRAELWQKEIAAFAEGGRKDFPKTKGVVFVGSSSIRGWRTLAQDFPGLNVLNRGFGGSHLEDVNFYAPEIVLPYRPKLIVLYAGENDLTAGKTVERVASDYQEFVRIVHGTLPKTRIIFVSLKPSPARWELREKFARANDLIKAATDKDKRQLFVDVWAPMLTAAGEPKPEIFQNDKLHLNSEGYKIWREILSPRVKKGLKGNFR